MKKRKLLDLLLVAALCLSLFPTVLAAEEAQDAPAKNDLLETAPQMPDNFKPLVLTGGANEWDPKEYAVSSDTKDIERTGRFDGSLDLVETQGVGAVLDYVLNISPASALDNVASVKAVVTCTNVKTGDYYVLGESDIDDPRWLEARFEHQFAETWYAINDNFVSLDSGWSEETEDGTLYKLFRIPALVDTDNGENCDTPAYLIVCVEIERLEELGKNTAGNLDAYVYGFSDVNSSDSSDSIPTLAGLGRRKFFLPSCSGGRHIRHGNLGTPGYRDRAEGKRL